MLPIACFTAALALNMLTLIVSAEQAAASVTGLGIFNGVTADLGCQTYEMGTFDMRGERQRPARSHKRRRGSPAGAHSQLRPLGTTSEVSWARPQSWTSVGVAVVCRDPETQVSKMFQTVIQGQDQDTLAAPFMEFGMLGYYFQNFDLVVRARNFARNALRGFFSELHRQATPTEAARLERVKASLLELAPEPSPDLVQRTAEEEAKFFETFIIDETKTIVLRSPIVSFVVSDNSNGMKLWTVHKLPSHADGVRELAVFDGVQLFDASGVALDSGALPLQKVYMRRGELSPLNGMNSRNPREVAEALDARVRSTLDMRYAECVNEHKSLVSELSITTRADPGEASFATNYILSVLLLI